MLMAGHTIIFALIAFVLVTLVMRLAGRLTADRFGSIWGWTAVIVLLLGLWVGLIWAPPDRDMGNVQRIMYVHFPSWVGTGAAFLTAFVASFLYLARRNPRFDYWAHAGVEAGLVFNAVGLITGSIWGRPTWGIWWTWDPRLTTTAIMFITFAGYLALRAYIEDPDARARVAAVVAIVAFINVPVVYMSVKWWRTLHQVQSSPMTVDPRMVVALRLMMLAFLLIAGWMMARRQEIAGLQGDAERRGWEVEVAR